MNIVKKEELNNFVYQGEMLSSRGCLSTCTFNNHIYVYKEPFDYTDEMINLHDQINSIKNKNLVLPSYFVLEKGKFIAYLTEYLNRFHTLYDLKYLSVKNKIFILKQAKKAILSMHNSGIIHGDLNSANIMYRGGKIKIIDFDDCFYGNNNPKIYNKFTKEYLKGHDVSTSLDIFMFNIATFSFLYNIAFYDVFDFDFVCQLSEEQTKVWQKTKEKKELTNNDFLINYY